MTRHPCALKLLLCSVPGCLVNNIITGPRICCYSHFTRKKVDSSTSRPHYRVVPQLTKIFEPGAYWGTDTWRIYITLEFYLCGEIMCHRVLTTSFLNRSNLCHYCILLYIFLNRVQQENLEVLFLPEVMELTCWPVADGMETARIWNLSNALLLRVQRQPKSAPDIHLR